MFLKDVRNLFRKMTNRDFDPDDALAVLQNCKEEVYQYKAFYYVHDYNSTLKWSERCSFVFNRNEVNKITEKYSADDLISLINGPLPDKKTEEIFNDTDDDFYVRLKTEMELASDELLRKDGVYGAYESVKNPKIHKLLEGLVKKYGKRNILKEIKKVNAK